jgi:tetratricopeptide (TPR) repeat protein
VDESQVTTARKLADLHLRLGSLALARAELEELWRHAALGVPGLADLAEARWRMGDLEAAADAATAHLEAGGTRPIAMVIAAEAAAAAGRPGEARTHVAGLGDLDAPGLEAFFAGMPQRAFWPSAPAVTAEPLVAFGGASRPPARADRAAGPGQPSGSAAATPDEPIDLATPEAAGPEAAPGLWGDAASTRQARTTPARAAGARATGARAGHEVPPGTDATALLGFGRDDLAAGGAVRVEAGLARLALALRLDPNLAAPLVGILAKRAEPAALLTLGDALRILGRALEAEAAYAAAGAALEQPSRRSDRIGR